MELHFVLCDSCVIVKILFYSGRGYIAMRYTRMVQRDLQSLLLRYTFCSSACCRTGSLARKRIPLRNIFCVHCLRLCLKDCTGSSVDVIIVFHVTCVEFYLKYQNAVFGLKICFFVDHIAFLHAGICEGRFLGVIDRNLCSGVRSGIRSSALGRLRLSRGCCCGGCLRRRSAGARFAAASCKHGCGYCQYCKTCYEIHFFHDEILQLYVFSFSFYAFLHYSVFYAVFRSAVNLSCHQKQAFTLYTIQLKGGTEKFSGLSISIFLTSSREILVSPTRIVLVTSASTFRQMPLTVLYCPRSP